MTTYTKQTATNLYEELLEVMTTIPSHIEQSPDDGVRLKIIAESLGNAISALKSRIS